MKRVILSFVWLLLAFAMLGQNYGSVIRLIDKKDGLVATKITSIIEAENGLVWIGCNNGLYRYDGVQFQHFTSSNLSGVKLLSNAISCLYVDNENRIWIGYSDGGFSVFNEATGNHKYCKDIANKYNLNGNNVVNIQTGIHNKIWVFFEDTAWIETNIELTTFSAVTPKSSNMNARNYRGAVYLDKVNKWYIYGSDGIGEFNPNNNTLKGYRFTINNKVQRRIQNSINSIYVGNNRLWLNTWGGGIVEFDYLENAFINFYRYNTQVLNDGVTNNVWCSAKKDDETVFITTSDSGFGYFNLTTKQFTFPKYDNRAFYCKKLLATPNGLWFSCESGIALYLFEHQKALRYPLAKSDIKQYERLNFPYYLATYKKLLITSAYYSSKYQHINDTFVDVIGNGAGRVLAVKSIGGDSLLSVSSFGIFLKLINKNDRQSQQIKLFKIEKLSISACSFFGEDEVLIGTNDGKLFLYNYKRATTVVVCDDNIKKSAVSKGKIFDVLKTPTGLVVACGEFGISIFNLKNGQVYDFAGYENKQYGMCKSVFDIAFFENKIWFTNPEFGLLSLSIEKPFEVKQEYSEQTGLPGNIFTALKVDNQTIWAICQNKIVRIIPSLNLINFWDETNGLSVSPDDWSSLEIINNKIWYSMPGAWYSISKKHLQELCTKQEVVLFDVFNNEKKIDAFTNLRIKSADFQLKIRYGIRNIARAENTKFRYRINRESDWIYPENDNVISLTNLSSGTYNLQIAYRSNSNKWSPPKTCLVFTVLPPFYKTWYFFLLLFLVLSAIYYAIYHQLLRRKHLVANFENKLAKTKIEALRSQMNPHFIFNSLNSLNYYIKANETQNATDFLGKFAKLIRIVLNHSKLELITLEEELVFIKLYLELEKVRFQNKLNFEINIASEVESDIIKIPTMIIQPYVENAIWHGIMHQENGGLVRINVNKLTNGVEIIIDDDGIGINQSNALKTRDALNHKSYGTKLTEERLRLYELSTGNKVTIKIEDKLNDNGTKVTLNIIFKE